MKRSKEQIKLRQDKIFQAYIDGVLVDKIAKRFKCDSTYPVKIAQRRGFMSRMYGLPLKRLKKKAA